MKRFTLAIAASVLLLGATAFAQTTPAPQMPDRSGVQQPQDRMERRAARMEQRAGERLNRLKADLKLTPAQEPLWAPVQAQLTKMRDEGRAARQVNADRFRTAELPDRLTMMSDRAARGATNLRELSAAVQPLWATLDASQKETVKKAMPGRGRGGDRR